jgi:hypothetical protein
LISSDSPANERFSVDLHRRRNLAHWRDEDGAVPERGVLAVQQQRNGAAHGLAVEEPALVPVLPELCIEEKANPSMSDQVFRRQTCSMDVGMVGSNKQLERWGKGKNLLTADGHEEAVAVVDEAAEAADVAAGAHGLAVALVVHPEHAVPGRRQPYPALCIFLTHAS